MIHLTIFALLCISLTSSTPLIPRIINGVNAPNTPWVARILTHYKNDGKTIAIASLCGGSLVAPSWVLTARHCIYDEKNKLISNEYFVSVGNVNFYYGQIKRVSVIHIYNSKDNSDDIALLKLENNVNGIAPVKVQYENNLKYGGRWATIYGWGTTETGKGTDILKTTNVVLYDRNKCDANSVCFNPKVTNSNACSGDSGGPMVINQNNEIILIGVTRAVLVVDNKPCTGDKTFYTSTSYYGDWIRNTIR